jgi:hypothetical protein
MVVSAESTLIKFPTLRSLAHRNMIPKRHPAIDVIALLRIDIDVAEVLLFFATGIGYRVKCSLLINGDVLL